MTQQEITLLNLGSSLDDIANIDPRGYGVCKLLYKAAREYTGEPLCVNGAKKLISTLCEGSVVFIQTGFILLPFMKPETDGVISSVLLANALAKGLGAKPVIICPEDCIPAVRGLASCLKLGVSDSYDELKTSHLSVSILSFTQDTSDAAEYADSLIEEYSPDAVISIECPGANEKGVYHNAVGINVTDAEAKQDILFEKLQKAGILNLAIGDLGNETGMGAIGEYIKNNIPYAGKNACRCGCGGGICARTKADNIITSTVSDWGCYSLIAMLAYMLENADIMHGGQLQKKMMETAAENGLIDMSGKHIPAIDGFGTEITCTLVKLMKELVKSTLSLKEPCKTWFEKAAETGAFG
ncbi:MAG: DUF4392 domain-containing protein [Clostridia bacterium]|nr:DUF4392 domain-containing protein [Clostridia bacterium]